MRGVVFTSSVIVRGVGTKGKHVCNTYITTGAQLWIRGLLGACIQSRVELGHAVYPLARVPASNKRSVVESERAGTRICVHGILSYQATTYSANVCITRLATPFSSAQ
jgi:hypothetical protein